MNQVITPLLRYVTKAETRNVGLLFMVNALLITAFVVRLPDIKSALAIDDGQLGLALLFSPLGVILSAPLHSYTIKKLGVGRTATLWAILMSISVFLISLASSYYLFIASLFFFGIWNGGLDISMNGVVSALEKKDSKVYMSTSHGLWSLGAMGGSLLAGYLAIYIPNYSYHFLIMAVASIVLVSFVQVTLWNVVDIREKDLKWKWPGWNLIILVGIVFCVFLVEGGIAEWNAIFFDEVLSSPKQYLGLGFAGFSGAMAIFRFAGDSIITRYPPKRILIVSLVIATIGIMGYSFSSTIWLSILTMAITGMGCSVIVPIVFYKAGHSEDIPPSLGLAIISTLGYAGFLVGPPIIGIISDSINLRMGFVVMGGFLVLSLVLTLFSKLS